MKLICSLLVAALSLTQLAGGATRPRYGGTLRVELRGTMSGFDMSAAGKAENSLLRDAIVTNVCDRLVTLNSAAEPEPSLAVAWRSERDGRFWRFTLRPDVSMQNGASLTPQMVVTALSVGNPDWRVRAEASDILFQSDSPFPNLLGSLAEPRNSICLVGNNNEWIGSGPFRVASFQPGQTIGLHAFDDAWQGRPFLDEIRIQMGKSLSDQAADRQLGKADLIEGDFTQQSTANSSVAFYTRPVELFALAFSRNHLASSNVKVREALADSVDRNSIYSVLLRRLGEPTGALLPEWITGYAHLFNTAQDLGSARQLRTQSGWTASLSLAYDGNDALAKLIAERVAVNANEAGITIQPRAESPEFRGFDAEIRLVRLRIHSPDTVAGLTQIGDLLDISAFRKAQLASSPEALYGLESGAVNEHSVIPVVYLPESFVPARGVHDFTMSPWGEVNLGNIWIEAAK